MATNILQAIFFGLDVSNLDMEVDERMNFDRLRLASVVFFFWKRRDPVALQHSETVA